ncbi:hypothetical protein B0T24DRAFT_632117 [Lasiosphaeria ovina]|uniref:Secreted protein n=1 Tax=Lasiosphaeria ovina TaxID=92902 RepID=A0AAE0K4C4_9PEZI|nr:hypothetical protein B0T24DRAFT_632117 [Lasiosphaeria ovina]
MLASLFLLSLTIPQQTTTIHPRILVVFGRRLGWEGPCRISRFRSSYAADDSRPNHWQHCNGQVSLLTSISQVHVNRAWQTIASAA